MRTKPFTRSLLILAALAAVTFGGGRRAEAEGFDGGILVVYGTAYLTATLPFAVNDVIGSDHSKKYGFVEAAIHVPLAAMWTIACFETLGPPPPDDPPNLKVRLPMAIVHAALAAHGVYTLVRPRRPKPKQEQERRIAIVPAWTPGGAGVGVGGTF